MDCRTHERGVGMLNTPYVKKDTIKNFFPVPNAAFDLGLHHMEISIYAYLLRIEDRRTYQCIVSYLRTNRIETRQQLTMQRDALQAEMDVLTEQRRQLYLARRRGVAGVDADIAAYTDRLRILRREWKQCCCIETDAQRIEQQLTAQREQEISEKGGREHGCRQRSR